MDPSTHRVARRRRRHVVDEDIPKPRIASGRIRTKLLPYPRPNTRHVVCHMPHRYGGTTATNHRRLRRRIGSALSVIRDSQRHPKFKVRGWRSRSNDGRCGGVASFRDRFRPGVLVHRKFVRVLAGARLHVRRIIPNKGARDRSGCVRRHWPHRGLLRSIPVRSASE